MDDGAEACVGFVGAQGNAPELLEFKKFSIRRRHLYLGARSLRSATRKLCESAATIKGCRKTPAFALLNFPQYPTQRYKTFISPVRQ
jgi:hypothetical protein